jgi:hypothetical protein
MERNIYLVVLIKALVIYKFNGKNHLDAYLKPMQCHELKLKSDIQISEDYLVKMLRKSGFLDNHSDHHFGQLLKYIEPDLAFSAASFDAFESHYLENDYVKIGYETMGKPHSIKDVDSARSWACGEIPKIFKRQEQPETRFFNRPIRPGFVVGREKKLAEIHDYFLNAKEKGILLLAGIGGIGKTTLAQEYLYQDYIRASFNNVIWLSVNGDLQGAFVHGVSKALEVDISAHPKVSRQLELIIAALNSCYGRNLMLIDNVNEHDRGALQDMETVFLQTQWKYLLTTRTAPDNFYAIKIDELDANEGFKLFAHHYIPDASRKTEVAPLLEHVNHHTLMIELLAKVGRKKGLSPRKLLQLLEEQDVKHPDLQRTIDTGLHGKSTKRLSRDTLYHYILSLFCTDHLLQEDQTMLRFFSLLPPDDIPIAHLKVLWCVQEDNVNEFEDRLDEIMQNGWIGLKYAEKDGLTQSIAYKMHPLIQDVVYHKLSPNVENCRPLFTTMDEILNSPSQYSDEYLTYAKSVADRLTMLHSKFG